MSKNLVICPVGLQSTHRLWNMGAKNFDTVLICYDEAAYEEYRHDDAKVYYQEGHKYPLIKDYLEKAGIEYDNYCFIDDDTGVNAEGLNKIFEFMSGSGVQVLHPAVYNANQPAKLIHPDTDCEYRFTNWTEIQCLFMGAEYLRSVMDLFDGNNSGWGLPELMYNRTNIPYCIYDLIPVIHIRPTNSGYMPLYESQEAAYEQLFEVLTPEDLYTKEVLNHKLRNIISFPIIFNREKAHYLEDCIGSLPPGSEVILVETIQDETKYGIHDAVRQGNNVFAKYYFDKWHYADARNAAKSLATRPIIFSIDSDERLLTHQHNEIIKAALHLYKSDFWGTQVRNMSLSDNFLNIGNLDSSVTEQVRMFKHLNVIKWKGMVHEQIDQSIKELNGKINDSTILIHHIGYEIGIDELKEKAEKRLKMLIEGGECLEHPHYFQYVIRESFNIHRLKTIMERNNTNE